VKPFKRMTSAPFTRLEVERSTINLVDAETTNSERDDIGKEIPIESLRIKRILADDSNDALNPTNSGFLHARLKQIDFLATEKATPGDAVERRVRNIRKREATRSASPNE
jgi:hypothetical protein